MKNKRTVIVFSLLLAIICLFQLSFTWKARSFETRAKGYAAKFPSDLRTKAYRRYVDSLGNTNIYNLGIAKFTYFDCKQREVNLGLDLRGGMNVILEVDKGSVIRGLSNDPEDVALNNAIKQADADMKSKGGDYVDLFFDAFKNASKNRKLSLLFTKGNRSGDINANSSDNEVLNKLREETTSAIDRVYEVVEKRINQSNVTQPTIQKVDGGRISVELPGVDNPKRMEDLVERSANLQFWQVAGNYQGNMEGAKVLESLYKASKNGPQTQDTTSKDTSKVASNDTAKKDDKSEAAALANSALFKIMPPARENNGINSHVALVKSGDRDKLIEMLNQPQFKSIIEASYKIVFSAKPLTEKSDLYGVYILKKDRTGGPSLESKEDNIIADANINTSQTGAIEVIMDMNPEAASQWAQITGNNIGKYIAIVLDDRVYSAPVVNQKISGGTSQITGNFDAKEAGDLANVLKAGKLPAPAKIVASEVVGPSLGDESITKGLNSLIFGFLSVIAFMLVYYNRAGWYAILAVFANVFLIMGILSSLGAALTLPGMAGIVLTVGMAVDANVLIFERIKEELHSGKSLKNAIQIGYSKAFSAILDSNLTTLIGGIALTFTGAGPAYGFAIILVIGIFSSMYTALLVSRLLIERRVNKGKSISFSFGYNEHVLKGKNIDFVGKRKLYYLISGAITLAGIIAFVVKGGISTGIDFRGGNSFLVQFDVTKNYNVDQIKSALDKGLPNSINEVKTFGADGQFRLVTTYMIDNDSKEDREKVGQDLIKAIENAGLTLGKNKAGEGPILSKAKVGASIATSTRNRSVGLVIVAIVGIFLYIVFRFRSVSYGLGATIALVHDVIMVLSIIAIIDGVVPFPTEFDQNLVAALLTLVGYSINDTVIVFDRIREFLSDKKIDRNSTTLINGAINDTLSRTIVTSATVFFVLLVLFIFGGDSLKTFTLAMLVGVIVGTYSSICIATPIVLDLGVAKKKQEKN